MPEGPELYKASCLVNSACIGRIFTGKVLKSAVNKNSEINFTAEQYTIRSESRGKEVALFLTPIKGENKAKSTKKEMPPQPLRILFRFGMSGKFMFGPVKEMHKHAHLNFYTNDKPTNVLSFVDVRRFGSWEVSNDWSKDRGPDPMFEYESFRSNVLNNLSDKAFNKSICETLLNQKYFNGIGNYLRAEILFRAKIPPFVTARSVLEKLPLDKEIPEEKKKKGSLKTAEPDLLELSHILPKEVICLAGAGYDPEGNRHGDYSAFMAWLQCYYNSEMKNLVDHDGRTIWFKGEAGPLAPKGGKSRGMVASRKRKNAKEVIAETDKVEYETPVKKQKETTKTSVKNKKAKQPIKKQDTQAPKVSEQSTRGNKNKVVTQNKQNARRKSTSSVVKEPAKKVSVKNTKKATAAPTKTNKFKKQEKRIHSDKLKK